MRGQQDRLPRGEQAQQELVEVLAVEHVVPRKGLVHEDVVRPLAEGEGHLELVLLPGREGARALALRQAEEVH